MEEHESRGASGSVVIRSRYSGTILFGSLSALWVLSLAVSLIGQDSVSGRIGAIVLFGTFLLLTAAGWIGGNWRRPQLSVSHDTVVYRKRKNTSYTLHRARGDELWIIPRFRSRLATLPPRLTILGTGASLPLNGFSPAKVTSACEAAGWRFDASAGQAARHAQRWLDTGRSAAAAQLIELFGPFPGVAADGDADTGLAAAVYEDCGDRQLRGNRSAAQATYRHAASLQRAFAEQAASPDERADRMAQAERIDGKAQG